MKRWILGMVLFAAVISDAKPNIVLLYADDLDADEINCTADMVDTWATHSGAKTKGF